MAIAEWLVDKSAAARAIRPNVATKLAELAGHLNICKFGELEQLYSARSASDYDDQKFALHLNFDIVPPPIDLLDRALALQHDLAQHHGIWHRTSIPDQLIAETALHHNMGVVHVDEDFDRIAEVRPLVARRLTP